MNRLVYLLDHTISSILGNPYHDKVKAYWFIKEKNSGDLVTPCLLKHYHFSPQHAYPNEAALISSGSILEKVPENFSGIILGTGFMHANSTRSFTHARVLAVRGPLTRDHMNAPKDILIGDPGLLVPGLLSKRQKKQYVLGFVPHYADKGDIRVRQMCKRYNREIHFIDIQANPFSVIREIDKCQNILSSSLHGLIFADALNIPNAWSELSDRVSGKGFKFRDYLLSVRRSTHPIVFSGEENLTEMISQMVTPTQAIVAERISGLDGAFQMLQKYLG